MKKLRTRQHFVDDFGMNHIEYHILSAHCILERYRNAYGYDAFMTIYNENGEPEEGSIQVQLKSMENLNYSEDEKAIVFDLSQDDLEFWLYSDLPVVFVVYDAMKKVAYWIDLLDYFKKNRSDLKKVNKFVRIYIPSTNVFTDKTVQKYKQF